MKDMLERVKKMRIYFALALCLVLLISMMPLPVLGEDRILAEDDGIVEVQETEDNQVMLYRFDNSGVRIYQDQDRKRSAVGYFVFNLSRLYPFDKESLVLLKIYANNPEGFEEDMLITANLFQAMLKGNKSSGIIMIEDGWEEPYLGNGFAVFDLTKRVKLLNLYNQSSIMLLLPGNNVSFGTLETGKPAEMVVV